jgi:hypothetical protein
MLRLTREIRFTVPISPCQIHHKHLNAQTDEFRDVIPSIACGSGKLAKPGPSTRKNVEDPLRTVTARDGLDDANDLPVVLVSNASVSPRCVAIVKRTTPR